MWFRNRTFRRAAGVKLNARRAQSATRCPLPRPAAAMTCAQPGDHRTRQPAIVNADGPKSAGFFNSIPPEKIVFLGFIIIMIISKLNLKVLIFAN